MVTPVDVDLVCGGVVHTGVSIASLYQCSPGLWNSPTIVSCQSISQAQNMSNYVYFCSQFYIKIQNLHVNLA